MLDFQKQLENKMPKEQYDIYNESIFKLIQHWRKDIVSHLDQIKWKYSKMWKLAEAKMWDIAKETLEALERWELEL